MASPILQVQRTRPRGQSDPSYSATLTQPTNARVPHRRTSISMLYDQDYKQYVHDSFVAGEPAKDPWVLEPPKEIKTIRQANQAYHFSHFRLKHRNITPRTEAFLVEYRKTLKEYLEKPEDGSKMIEVQTLTRILHSETILYKDPAPKDQDAMTAVRELAILRYYADYGDYLAFLCTSFRQKCMAAKVKNADMLIGKTWTEVQKIMEKEDELREKYRRDNAPGATQGRPLSPMTTLIFAACLFLGLDFHNVKYCINWYAKRNENAHSNVTSFIRNCDWDGLGRQLWKDMDEIPSVFGPDDVKKMTESLKRLRDQFFIELTATSRIATGEALDLLSKKQARDMGKMKARSRQRRLELAAEKKRLAKVQKGKNKVERQKRG
ncbi:MAG: hypothetical protein Q9208_005646 [Pyrenodesmia sp. 3 TL-2023]